jgi:hypothetical protein
MLVDRLPNAALAELLDSLKIICEFHQGPRYLPAIPAPPNQFTARLDGTYVRPTFAIEEE